MMNDERLIERYFCDELPAEERAAFEERRAADGAFRREVEAYEKTLRTIRLEGRKQLRGRLAERGRLLDTEKKSPRPRLWWWLGLAALVVVCAVWWFLGGKTETTAPMSPVKGSYPENNHAPPQSETPAPSVPVVKKPSPIADRQKQLPAPSASPGVRGKDTTGSTDLDAFVGAVWETRFRASNLGLNEQHLPVARMLEAKNFTNAYVALQLLEPSDTLDFLKGYCLLEMREGREALRYFSKLKTGNPWQQPIAWYIVLGHLLAGEQQEALSKAKSIAKTAGHPFQRQAMGVVEKLE